MSGKTQIVCSGIWLLMSSQEHREILENLETGLEIGEAYAGAKWWPKHGTSFAQAWAHLTFDICRAPA